MLDKEFDKFVLDQFNDHPSPVPDDMWLRIKGVADNDRKAFFFWKWYYIVPSVLIISLLAAYFMFAYYLLTPAGKMKSKNDTGVHSKEQMINDSVRQGGRQLTEQGTDGNMGRMPVEEKKLSGEKGIAGEKGVAGGRSVAGGKSVTGGKSVAGGKSVTGERALANMRKPKGESWGAGEKNGRRKKHTQSGKSDSVSGISEKDFNPAADGASEQLKENKADSSKGGFGMSGEKSAVLKKDSTVGKSKQTVRPSASRKDSLAKKMAAIKKDEPPRTPKKGLLRDKPWYMEVYVSPDLPFTPRRNWLSYSTGIRLSKMLTQRLSVSIGLQYSRINLKNSIGKRDSLTFLPPEADHFKNFDIPILIGYETGNAHFRSVFHAGIIYNEHTCPDGGQYNPVYGLYRRNTGISLYLGMGLMARLNERISLFTEPYLRLQLSNRGSSTIPFSQRLDVGGLNLGLRYDFKKRDSNSGNRF